MSLQLGFLGLNTNSAVIWEIFHANNLKIFNTIFHLNESSLPWVTKPPVQSSGADHHAFGCSISKFRPRLSVQRLRFSNPGQIASLAVVGASRDKSAVLIKLISMKFLLT